MMRIIKAFGYSLAGFKAAWASEASFRQEVVFCALLTPLPFYFGVGNVECALMLGSLILLLVVELLNTAVETIIERISPEIHPLSKKAKDIGSAAVFLAFLLIAVVWGSILLGH